jgi:hypothetical protein
MRLSGPIRVAYQSDESGRNEIYVRPFPAADGGANWTVSQGGGTQPRWRGDSKELFYLAPDGNVMAVPVSTSVDRFQPGTPAALFKGPPNADGWDVSADGKGSCSRSPQASPRKPRSQLSRTGYRC